MLDKIEAITEKKPFIAQAQATYTRLCEVRLAIVLSPTGMKAPKHNPNGAIMQAVTKIRKASEKAIKLLMTAGIPNR
jgi:hypothetical protein